MADVTATGSFYLSVSNDRPYVASDFNNRFKVLASNGVLTRGVALTTQVNVTAVSGEMQSNIASGYVMTEGIVVTITEGTVDHDAADVTNPRIDTIVVESNQESATRASSVKIVKGTPAGTPVAPTLTQTSTIWQEPLANVQIPANATDADNFTYTDRRQTSSALFEVPDNSLTNVKLGSDIKIGSLASLLTTIKTSIVNAINELKGRIDANEARLPYCMLRKSAFQQSGSKIIWDTEQSDDFNMHNNTNNTRITIPTGQGGEYAINCGLIFSKTGLSNETIELVKNGNVSTYIGASQTIGSTELLKMDGTIMLNAGDYIEVEYNGNLTSSVFIIGNAGSVVNWFSYMTVKRIR